MSKIINLDSIRLENTYQQISALFSQITTEIEITFSPKQLKFLLTELFKLYKAKNLLSEFNNDMYTYFYETIALAFDQEETYINFDFVLNSLSFFQSYVEISPEDMSKTLMKCYHKIGDENHGK